MFCICIFLFCFAVPPFPFPFVSCLYDVPNFVLRGQGVYCWLEFKICRMFNSLKENIHSFPCRKSLTNCCPNHGVERHIWSATAVCNRSSFTLENMLFHRFLNKSSGNLTIFIKRCFMRWRDCFEECTFGNHGCILFLCWQIELIEGHCKSMTCKRRCRCCFYILCVYV